MASAATTPSPATWAIARSMKTIPRSRTSWPKGTWVARTSSPARKAGKRIATSTLGTGAPREAQGQPLDGIVEQAEQVARAIGPADRIGQHHRRHADALSDEFRAERVRIGRIYDA